MLIFSWYFKFIHFSLIKCEWIATENICKTFYCFIRKIKLNLVLNFDLTLGALGLSRSRFVKISLSNLFLQTKSARERKFYTRFTSPHLSGVTCHVSKVMCHVSHVTCHNFFVFVLQSGQASEWRVCYQCGLPRLVY